MPLTIVEIIKQAEQGLSSPFLCRGDDGEWLSCALSVWAEACDNVPPEWHWENDERDLPAAFDPVAASALVARCSTPDFWRTL